MAKKSFSRGIDALLESSENNHHEKRDDTSVKSNKRGRPKTAFKEISKTSQLGTVEGETRATFIVNESILEKIKAVAYWDRLQIKDVVNDALIALLESKGDEYIQKASQEFLKKKKD